LVINVNHAFGNTLQTRDITRSLRVDLYETTRRLIVIYGDKWNLTNNMIRVVMTSERKILREMLGPVGESGTWRIKMQKETHTKFKSPDILTNKSAKIGMVWTCFEKGW
jgi:hypothetical protein